MQQNSSRREEAFHQKSKAKIIKIPSCFFSFAAADSFQDKKKNYEITVFKNKNKKKYRCSWSLSQEHQTGSNHPEKQQ
jgi:hypothetical protein